MELDRAHTLVHGYRDKGFFSGKPPEHVSTGAMPKSMNDSATICRKRSMGGT
jgi:hypothetical protein